MINFTLTLDRQEVPEVTPGDRHPSAAQSTGFITPVPARAMRPPDNQDDVMHTHNTIRRSFLSEAQLVSAAQRITCTAILTDGWWWFVPDVATENRWRNNQRAGRRKRKERLKVKERFERERSGSVLLVKCLPVERQGWQRDDTGIRLRGVIRLVLLIE